MTIPLTGATGAGSTALQFFYKNAEQLAIAQRLIAALKSKGLEVVTALEPAGTFWQAEARHQQYYDTRGIVPTTPVRYFTQNENQGLKTLILPEKAPWERPLY